jgi:hypothetical protein
MGPEAFEEWLYHGGGTRSEAFEPPNKTTEIDPSTQLLRKIRVAEARQESYDALPEAP